MSKRVTIQDLADELDTTPSTVSRALRDHKGISNSMKKKVHNLAKKRNYKVNRAASNLRAGESKTIGVIVPRINRDFFSNVIAGIEEVAFEAGYSIVICQTHDQLDKEKKYLNTLISNNVAGILISIGLETKKYNHFTEIDRLGIPLIFFDRAFQKKGMNKILIDDTEGAYQAVNHLISMGYKRIAHFAGPQSLKIYVDRKKGYLAALRDNNIAIDENLIITNNLKQEEGKRDIKKLLQLNDPPDALFSASDFPALGALLYLKDKGYSIPNDFGIVGFSNEKFTALISPSLTSVDQHSQEIGQHAAKICIEEINSKVSTVIPRTIILSPSLIIRESSKRR